MLLGPDPFEFLIPLSAIVCTFIFLMRFISLKQANVRYKQDVRGQRLDELQAQVEDYNRRVRSLEERTRVLERIVTDDSATLRHEIERLRARAAGELLRA